MNSGWRIHVSLLQMLFNERMFVINRVVIESAGHLLMSLSEGEGVKWANKVQAQWGMAQGRDKIFDHMFTLRDMKGNKDSSFLMNNGLHTSFKVTMPSDVSLRELDKGTAE